MHFPILSIGACLLASVHAHFDIVYPEPRGKNTGQMIKGPCGAFSSPSNNRTKVSLDDHAVSVALSLHHDRTIVEVLLGIGNDVGDAFNIKLVPSFQLEGMGDFCLPKVDLEAKGVKIEDGTNATLQVITNGDPKGGLYSCADITFSNSVTFSKYDSCKNNTGFKENTLKGPAANLNANETAADGTPQNSKNSDSDSSPHHHSDDDDENTAHSLKVASWGVLGAVVAAGVALI
ncbi:hypothetical protein KEM54_001588 [Ascosphaera aggregata]|nr:hypothetical protein KEM54_001588 [Ascosphaera aggregata]